MRVPAEEFRELPLEAHAVLRDVPLHDVSAVDLPRGGPGRSIADLRAILDSQRPSLAVRGLLSLRFAIGRLFGWDSDEEKIDAHARDSYLHRVPPDVLSRSQLPPGSREGPFRVLYMLEREAVGELRNATVHAFGVVALVETPRGYRLYLGIYVRPVTRWTALYMAAIDPFRRFIVYPSLLGQLERRWRERYGK